MSSICTSSPCSVNASRAASRMSCLFRIASARMVVAIAKSVARILDKRNYRSVYFEETGTHIPFSEEPHMSPADTPRAKNLVLALLAMAQFVVVLDASIVNVALPSIGRALDFAQGDLSWVVNAYTLVFGGFLLLGGRLADLLGRRRMFVYGMWLFALASLLGGLAQSDVWLIAARALQGLGAALISPAALAILTTTFAEGSERNKALGVWGAVAGSGGAVGVLLGGMLTEWAGWEWVLFVNVPIGIAAALLAPRLLPESRNEGERHFDVAGAVTITAGLSLLVYALVDANDAGWASTQTLGLGAIAVALIGGFYLIERRQTAPLVPFPGIFRSRTITGINVSAVLVAASLFSMFFFISLYMQNVLGYSALKAGLAYLPLAVGIIVTAGASAPLVTRFGFKPVLIAGLLITAGGLLWFSQVHADGSFVGDILFPSLLAAIALGLAILVTVANSRTDDAVAAGKPAAVALTEGFQSAFLAGAGIAIAGAILAIVLVSGRASREHAQAAQRGELVPVAAAA